MLYIHSLKDLNLKSADIESTPLIRELKKAVSFPVDSKTLREQLIQFFVSQIDLESITKSLEIIPQSIDDIKELSKTGKELELINIQRAVAGLNELPAPLQNSIAFSSDISGWQEQFVTELAEALNKIAVSKNPLERKEYEQKIGQMLERILRNKEAFSFMFCDIVNEAQTARINNLIESADKGVFFHVNLEEHLKKQDFEEISRRIAKEDIEKTRSIISKMQEIKKGVDRAYDINMRMINLAVILYSYVKWLRASRL
jgi:Txe/YoeB family toxin of Txe-Axe toxin-antitoxin module